MTENQISLVKNSWKTVAKIDPLVVGNIFYTKLFSDTPELEYLFKGNIEEQSKKLLMMLNVVISGLDKLETLKTAIQQLGMRHKNYGVKDEHYSKVGAALLWTLEKGLGDAFNKPTKDAWIKCYTILSNTMMNASKEAAVLIA